MTPPAAATVPGSGDAPPILSEHERSVLGVVVYSCTVSSIRHAKDADRAPSMAERGEMLRMSAERVAALDGLGALAASVGADAAAAAEPFMGALGDFDQRLRPLDWAERLLKTHLALGLLADFCRALAAGLSEPLRSGLGGALVEDRFTRFAADALVPGIDSDPQLAGRLGLWGRRVVGEEIGTLQRMLASFPPLLDGAAGLEDIHAVLSEGAVTRMRSLGLRD